MRKLIKIFSIMLLMVMGSNNVFASECVFVNNQDVCEGVGDITIGSGNAKLENNSGEYILTLDNVNINNYKVVDEDAYGIYFENNNLTIKLVGSNNISFIDKNEQDVEEYDAIYVNNNLNIIGNGSLSINLNGDYDLVGIKANLITLGEEDKSGPTVNSNIDAGQDGMSILISGDFNIYNTDIKGKVKGSLAVGIFSNIVNPCNIKNSDINLDIMTSGEGYGIFSYDKDLIIEDSDILFRMYKYGDEGYEYGIVCPEKMTIKDSRVVIITSEDADESRSLFNNNSGSIELIHTTGKEFLLVGNSSIESDDVTYTNIDNTMVYVSPTSLEDIKLNSNYNISNVNELINEKYYVITTGIDNKIISGNNQNIKKNSATTYNVGTNHFRYLVKEIKLNDIVLDEEDYTLNKDGKVLLNSTGLSKLNNLDVGTYKLKLDYYVGNDLEVNLNIVNSINNPKTMDNIDLYIIFSVISLISLIVCFRRKSM